MSSKIVSTRGTAAESAVDGVVKPGGGDQVFEPFLRLPAELRLKIWESLAEEVTVLMLSAKTVTEPARTYVRLGSVNLTFNSISRSCREARELMQRKTTLQFIPGMRGQCAHRLHLPKTLVMYDPAGPSSSPAAFDFVRHLGLEYSEHVLSHLVRKFRDFWFPELMSVLLFCPVPAQDCPGGARRRVLEDGHLGWVDEALESRDTGQLLHLGNWGLRVSDPYGLAAKYGGLQDLLLPLLQPPWASGPAYHGAGALRRTWRVVFRLLPLDQPSA